MWVRSLDWEDPLEEEMATHSSILDQSSSLGIPPTPPRTVPHPPHRTPATVGHAKSRVVLTLGAPGAGMWKRTPAGDFAFNQCPMNATGNVG